MQRGFKFLKCPDCGRHGVHLVLSRGKEDHYSCRYCVGLGSGFCPYIDSASSIDREPIRRLAEANPGRAHEIVGLD